MAHRGGDGGLTASTVRRLTREQMQDKLEMAPLDELTALVMEQARRPQEGAWSHTDCKSLGHCDFVLTDSQMVKNTHDCHGTGFILDTSSPLFRALWEECPGGGSKGTGHFSCIDGKLWRMTEDGMRPFKRPHSGCRGTGYIPRSRAGVARGLRSAIHAAGHSHSESWSSGEQARAAVWIPKEWHTEVAAADNDLDALCAALLANLRARRP